MRYKSSDIKDIAAKFTLLFALCSLVIWLPYILQGKTFVWNVDGISQHIPALIFYRHWLGDIVRSFFAGHPDIPMWSFNLGEGSDVINTLHYYCIGDPLCLIVALFPASLMGYCYTLLSVIRMYLAGIAFIFFARQVRPCASVTAFCCAGLMYSLSNWALYCAARHSFFLNPLILLPLMLLGIEKIVAGKKPYLFILATALTAFTSVYFFYMIVIMSVIYGIVRYPSVKKLLTMLGCGILGSFMGCVVLLPQLVFLLSDGRNGDKGGAYIFYDVMHYLKIPAGFASGMDSDYLLLGFGAAGVIMLIVLFTTKGNLKLKIFSGICLLFMILPVLGSFMNGMSYATNRWSFALTLLISFMFLALWDDLSEDIGKSFKKLIVIFSSYGVIIIALSFVTGDAALSVVQVISGLLIILALSRTQFKKFAPFIVILNLVINGLVPNTLLGGDRTHDFLTNDLVNLAMDSSDSSAVASIGGGEGAYPVRYSGPYLNENTSAVFGTYSTQYYWSQTNGAVTSARRAIELPEYRDYYYTGYDGRAGMNYLAGVRYYVVPEDKKDSIRPPLGYGDPVTEGGFVIYKTDKAIPFASFFGNAVSKSVWDTLSVTGKQDVLLADIVLEGEGSSEPVTPDALTLRREKDINAQSDGTFVLPLDVEAPGPGELYVTMKGLEFKGYQGEDRADISVSGKGVSFYTQDFNWYNGKEDFAVCLGVVEEGVRKPKITFTTPGDYKIREVTVEFIPEEAILSKASALIERSSVIKDTKAKGDRVSFSISSKEDGYVLLQIPYSSGWSAFCDGSPLEVMRADLMYTGVKVPGGDHKITLRYRTPMIESGAVLSAAAVIAFIALVIIDKVRSSAKMQSEGGEDTDILIAVASHKPYDIPKGKMYIPVLAGASRSGVELPSGWKADNTGDNISDLNPYYCELTAYYWAVRNAPDTAGFIGLVHYRRLFGTKKNGAYDEGYLKSYLPKARVFVPVPRNYYIETLGSHYIHTLDGTQLDAVREALRNICPEYLPFWEKILEDKSGYMFNMNIMARPLAEDYLEWLMKVLGEVCKIKDPAGEKENFDKRFPGRLSELLFNCWLDKMVQDGKIKADEIAELSYYSPERVDWPKKIKSFLEARFLGKKYHKSF